MNFHQIWHLNFWFSPAKIFTWYKNTTKYKVWQGWKNLWPWGLKTTHDLILQDMRLHASFILLLVKQLWLIFGLKMNLKDLVSIWQGQVSPPWIHYIQVILFLVFRSPVTKNCKRKLVYCTRSIHDISDHKIEEKQQNPRPKRWVRVIYGCKMSRDTIDLVLASARALYNEINVPCLQFRLALWISISFTYIK